MEPGHNGARYRVDIDGLRAFAVLPVVLFHAGVAAFGGGYVGVDVFFVISGFLITGILLQNGSIVSFYQRRARRILPALLTILALTLLVGAFLLLPHDLIVLARSALATLGFASNVYFWRSSGYFAEQTELWPLLHTWSLGVEEQFYIFFPLILLGLKRLPRPWLVIAIALLALASFGVCVVAMEQAKRVLAFYLAPTRAWELLVGSLLAVRALPVVKPRWARAALAALGLVAILLPVFTYSAGTLFPGWAALPPVLGAALVIWAGQDGDHALVPVLGWAPLRFIGLISYSLYLWHWPVLAFLRYVQVDPLGVPVGLAAVIVATGLAALSWRFIERPFRHGFSDRAIWLMSLGGIATIALAAGVILLGQGWPKRFAPQIVALNAEQGNAWRCGMTDLVLFGGYYACGVNLPSGKPADADIVVWGDSHAQMYIPAIKLVLGDRKALLVNANGCAPVLGESMHASCGVIQRRNYAAILKLPARTVILAQNWGQYRDEAGRRLHRKPQRSERYQDAIRRLRDLVAGLRASGRTVLITTPIPAPGYPIASVASRELLYHGAISKRMGTPSARYYREFANIFAALTDMAAKDPGVRIVRIDRIACGAQMCPYIAEGRAMYSDQGHYAESFTVKLAPAFKQALDGAPAR